MLNNGYILLSRSLLDSDVFASQKLLKIWVWCLIKAGYKDRSVPLKVGKGVRIVKIKRGEFIFGRMKAEEELYIDGSTIYKSIHKLKDMDMIMIKSNNQYSVITICNYDTYQQTDSYKVTTKEQPSNNQVTAEEQPSNTNKQVKQVKKVKHLFKDSPYFELEFLKSEINKKYNIYNLDHYYDSMLNWSESNGEKKLNWLAVCRTWINRDVKENKAVLIVNNDFTHVEYKFKGQAIIRLSIDQFKSKENIIRNNEFEIEPKYIRI